MFTNMHFPEIDKISIAQWGMKSRNSTVGNFKKVQKKAPTNLMPLNCHPERPSIRFYAQTGSIRAQKSRGRNSTLTKSRRLNLVTI